ncbi:DNA-binding domain protein [Vibrio phage 1.247.A._10N.261.54.E12]|nr:DNA-binding domain protein [Vibrio phage 1.247.A._10N.261.54.E12]AUR98177.1 DNA-binding domain protein [Vibrio phage 1.247.B._10N.261.54.E12]
MFFIIHGAIVYLIETKRDLEMNIGKSISVACAMRTKTRGELAECLGVNKQTVSNWSQGHTSPKPFQMELIAAFFGMKTSEFIALGEDE